MSKRLNFFLVHLAISLSIALLVAGGVFFIWYPLPLVKAVGVTHIFLIMLAIDVIIGPLLGLLVYKEGKKSLKLDLGIIILIQLIALGFGIYTIAQGRPAWIVYSVDRFELVRVNEISSLDDAKIKSIYESPSWLGAKYVAVKLAADKKQRENDMFNAVFGLTLAKQPERYISIIQAKSDMQQSAQNLNILNQFNDKALVEKTLSNYPQATAFVPLKANAVDMTVLINKEKGEVVKIVDLRPWK